MTASPPRCGARPGRASSCRPTPGSRRPVQIQFQPNGTGAWTTLQTINTAGYFDVHVKIPSNGNLRLGYSYPQTDAFLPVGFAGTTVFSRTIKIT